jgi:hypothetical protein
VVTVGYGLDGQGPGRTKDSFPKTSVPALGPTHHLIQRIPGIKQPPSCVEVKNEWSYASTPLRLELHIMTTRLYFP